MKKRVLFLFTKTFPFGNGEQYLWQELPFLQHSFEEVIIVPCSIFHRPDEAIILPDGVSVFPVNLELKQSSILDKIADRLFVKRRVKEALTNERNREYFKLNRNVAIGIMKQQLACARRIKEFISEKNLDLNDCRFYSYWLHNSAVILGIMKDKGWINSYISRAHSYDLYHQDFYPEKQNKSPLLWEFFKFRTCDRVLCISEHGKQFLVKHYPQWKGKFGVSRLGVQAMFGMNPESDEEVFRIVTCSTIQPLKRLFLIPEILKHVNFPVEWVHFGAGDQPYEVELINSWNAFGFKQHTFRRMGFVHNRDVRKYYSQHHIDLFVNVSSAEGVPVSLMEAASHGIPLMATDVYGSSEVAGGSGGKVLQSNFDSVEAAAEIIKIREDHTYSDNLRKGSVRIFEELFNAEKCYSDFIKTELK